MAVAPCNALWASRSCSVSPGTRDAPGRGRAAQGGACRSAIVRVAERDAPAEPRRPRESDLLRPPRVELGGPQCSPATSIRCRKGRQGRVADPPRPVMRVSGVSGVAMNTVAIIFGLGAIFGALSVLADLVGARRKIVRDLGAILGVLAALAGLAAVVVAVSQLACR